MLTEGALNGQDNHDKTDTLNKYHNPDEVDRRKAIGRVHRLKVKEWAFRTCPVASPPSPGVQEGYKGVGWSLWARQMVMIYNLDNFNL